MRQAFANLLQHDAERRRLSTRVLKGIATAEDHQRHAELTNAVIDGLVSEMRLLIHDVAAASSRARRYP
jgi:hypothetical protein